MPRLITLEDIRAVTIEQLRSLAALAPAGDTEKDPPSGMPPAKKSRPGGDTAAPSGLGPLMIDRYLDHYGIEYNVKPDGTRTLYRLARCLFNENHGRNDAAIVQDVSGKVTYQCFHDSCKGYRFEDARQKISGSEILAKFCKGYDPEKLQTKKKPKPPPPAFEVYAGPPDWRQMFPGPVSPPEEVDHRIFYIERNGRWMFEPLRMSLYLKALRGGHIVYAAGDFWAYKDGLWAPLPDELLGRTVVQALKFEVRPHSIKGSIEILRHEAAIEMADWPVQDRYINCISGMVDVSTGEIHPHAPEYWSRAQVPCNFGWDGYKRLDRFLKYIDEVWPGDLEQGKADVLQEFMGYCLVPHCRYQRALFLYGQGANGKSVMLDVIEDMVGTANVSALSIHDLSERFNRSMLAGKLVNIAYETDSKNPASMETFKAASAGDIIKAEEKYGRPFMFRNYAKFVIAMNDPPVFGQTSTHNIMRRLLVMKFNRIFKEDEQDPDLKDKLKEERDGIFMWSLMGYSRLLGRGRFLEPAEMLKVKKSFEREVNPILYFVEECLDVTGEETTTVKRSKLYEDYKEWAKKGGYRPLSAQKFYRHIETLPNVTPFKNPLGSRGFRGLAIKELADD